jgi:hypothetical protein
LEEQHSQSAQVFILGNPQGEENPAKLLVIYLSVKKYNDSTRLLFLRERSQNLKALTAVFVSSNTSQPLLNYELDFLCGLFLYFLQHFDSSLIHFNNIES